MREVHIMRLYSLKHRLTLGGALLFLLLSTSLSAQTTELAQIGRAHV